MSTVAIVLAADPGPAFIGSKYLASVNDEPMLQHVVNDASTWPVDAVIVVLGPDAEQIIDVIDFKDFTVVVDAEWEEGSASPLRAALDLASRDRSVRRCVVARGDQPGVNQDVIASLLDAAAGADADATVPKYRYSVGWPVVLDVSLWEHLLGSEGSVDLLDVVASYSGRIEEVWFDHLAPTRYEVPDDLPQARR
jgi:molybdenum cofactor cytidylyltransferase